MKKKLISLVTALATLLSLVITLPIPVGASPGDYSGGSGTAEAPYLIGAAEDLQALADNVQGGSSYENQFFKLTADIDLSGVCGENVNGVKTNWKTIGVETTPFKGTFDGDHHTVSSLYINTSGDGQGLFGYINDGTVKNLSVSGTVKGNDFVGGICGRCTNGTIENCSNKATVNGGLSVGGVCGRNGSSVIQSCHNNGAVSGQINVGGVCGENTGSVKNCYNTAAVSANYNVGGVCGENTGSMENCYNTGAVSADHYVGGVCGRNTGPVKNCYNTAAVSGRIIVGGVCGRNNGSTAAFENCYSFGTVAGKNDPTGGVCGDNTNGASITNCYYNKDVYNQEGENGITTADFAEESSFTGWDFSNIWLIEVISGRPQFKNEPETDGTKDKPYVIASAQALERFRDSVNSGNAYTNQFIQLTADIDLSSVCGQNIDGEEISWEPIGGRGSYSFEGTFDGGGHTISNLYINVYKEDNQGLFGRLKYGTIQNLGVSGKVYSDGGFSLGGVCAYNSDGSILGCCNMASVSGFSYMGGICGENSGGIIKNITQEQSAETVLRAACAVYQAREQQSLTVTALDPSAAPNTNPDTIQALCAVIRVV